MEVIKSKPATNEFRNNFDRIFRTTRRSGLRELTPDDMENLRENKICVHCLGKGKITFGDDTESGREEVTCDCRKKS